MQIYSASIGFTEWFVRVIVCVWLAHWPAHPQIQMRERALTHTHSRRPQFTSHKRYAIFSADPISKRLHNIAPADEKTFAYVYSYYLPPMWLIPLYNQFGGWRLS